jgi:hypothetical protein
MLRCGGPLRSKWGALSLFSPRHVATRPLKLEAHPAILKPRPSMFGLQRSIREGPVGKGPFVSSATSEPMPRDNDAQLLPRIQER